tara:strand:- start:142 stop:495 length:354 start_codon:yes stop_codon:yes gene_type:complete
MIIFKKKGSKFSQKSYDNLFHNIEYNLRESGFGDVTVNKKMKEFNKILYDILLKIDEKKEIVNTFKLNPITVKKYFNDLDKNNDKYNEFERYFNNFYNFCFEYPLDNMIEELNKFEY